MCEKDKNTQTHTGIQESDHRALDTFTNIKVDS